MKAGWEVKPLGEICAFQRGLTYSKKDEVDSGGTSVLRATNVNLETGELDLSEIRYIRSEVSVPHSKMVKPGTLLICTASGSKKHLGKTALIDRPMDFAFGGFMGLLKPDESLLPKYLQWLMRSDYYWAFIDGLSDGANINNLKFKQLAEFPIPLPPLEEQRRIVAILDEAFEGLVRARKNAEANLESASELLLSALRDTFKNESKNWETDVSQDTLPQNSRPPSGNKSRALTQTGGRSATLRPILGSFSLAVMKPDFEPRKGWAWTPLSNLARLESGHTPSRKHPEYWDGNIPWIGIKDAKTNHGGVVDSTNENTNELGIENSSARVLPSETVCLSRTASVGYVTVMGRDVLPP